jgi:hypothetical protein
MLSILSDFLVKLLAQVLPIVLRWHYRPEKIAEKIKIRVCSEGDGIVFWGGEIPYAVAWLQITNLSPFPICFDRIYGNFWYGTRLAYFCLLKQQSVGPAEEIRVYVVADLTAPQEAYIAKNFGKMETKLTIGALGECKINNFEIEREIRGNNVQFHNFKKIA